MSRTSFLKSDFLDIDEEPRIFTSNEEILKAWQDYNALSLNPVTLKGYSYEIAKFMDNCGDGLVTKVTLKQFRNYLSMLGGLCRHLTRREQAFGRNKAVSQGEIWCTKRLPMSNCGPANCSGYQSMRIETVEKHINAIVKLYDYLSIVEAVPSNFVREAKKEWLKDNRHRREVVPKRVPTKEEIERMIIHTPYLVRKTMFLLWAKTGPRLGEVVELRMDREHYRPEEGWIKIPTSRKGIKNVRGKRKGNPYLIVDEQLLDYLKMYEEERAIKLARLGKESDYLFVNHQGLPFASKSGGSTINRRVIWPEAVRCGIMVEDAPRGDRITSHGFRHFFSDYIKKRGNNREGGIDSYWWNILRGDLPKGNEANYVHPGLVDIKREYNEFAPVLDVPALGALRRKRERANL